MRIQSGDSLKVEMGDSHVGRVGVYDDDLLVKLKPRRGTGMHRFNALPSLRLAANGRFRPNPSEPAATP